MKGFGGKVNPKKKKKISIATKNEKQELISKGFYYHSQGNICEAEKYYKNFIKKGYRDSILFFNYGMICQQKGQIENAIRLYETSISLSSINPEAHFNLGNIYRDVGQLQKAEKSMKNVLEIKPDF